MIRFVIIVLLVVAAFACASPSSALQAPEQSSAPGGLGNTRADLDLVYGAVRRTNVTDFGDYASDAVSYENEWVFYLLAQGTTPSPDDRAFIIHRYAPLGASFSYPEAIDLANQLLPADVVPTSDLVPYDIQGTVLEYRQTFYSEAIARLFPDPELYPGVEPGTVWLVLALDYAAIDPTSNFSDVNVRIDHPAGAG